MWSCSHLAGSFLTEVTLWLICKLRWRQRSPCSALTACRVRFAGLILNSTLKDVAQNVVGYMAFRGQDAPGQYDQGCIAGFLPSTTQCPKQGNIQVASQGCCTIPCRLIASQCPAPCSIPDLHSCWCMLGIKAVSAWHPCLWGAAPCVHLQHDHRVHGVHIQHSRCCDWRSLWYPEVRGRPGPVPGGVSHCCVLCQGWGCNSGHRGRTQGPLAHRRCSGR